MILFIKPNCKIFYVLDQSSHLFLLQVGRVARGSRLLQGRVEVPLETFAIDELFAEPPQREGEQWKPATVRSLRWMWVTRQSWASWEPQSTQNP